jgi:hypothetical protein
MVRFQNGEPRAIWLSQHAYGQAFTYEAVEKDGRRVSYIDPFYPLCPLQRHSVGCPTPYSGKRQVGPMPAFLAECYLRNIGCRFHFMFLNKGNLMWEELLRSLV